MLRALQRRRFATGVLRGGEAIPYINKCLAVQPANLLAFFPLNETSGLVADNAEGTAARDGAYSNITLNQVAGPFKENNAGALDGLLSYVNMYSASLAAAFNTGIYTVNLWMKRPVDDAAVRLGIFMGGNTTNYMYIGQTANPTIKFRHIVSGTPLDVDLTTTSTAWNMYTQTADSGTGELKAYFNGSQTGVTKTGLTAWNNGVVSGLCNIGSYLSPPQLTWKGNLMYVGLWKVALGQPDITTLYNGGALP